MNQIKHASGKTELQRRVCRKCSIYYPTLKALNTHSKICTTDISSEEEDLELDHGDTDISQEPDNAPLSGAHESVNIFDQLQSLYG